MSEMIELETSELTDESLAWSVAKAEGLTVFMADPQYGNPCRVMVHFKRNGKLLPQQNRFKPQADWSQGGPLIEKYTLNVKPHVTENGQVKSWSAGMTWPCDTMPAQCGPTMLIAACRAVVMMQLGSVVMVPKELMP